MANNNTNETRSWDAIMQERRENKMRDLWIHLADMVRSGDLTDTEANEWAAMKADQWA